MFKEFIFTIKWHWQCRKEENNRAKSRRFGRALKKWRHEYAD